MSFNCDRHFIECCKDCKPPKRYPGCGGRCPEYQKEKAKLKELKAAERSRERPCITNFDFDVNCSRDPRKRKKKINRL